MSICKTCRNYDVCKLDIKDRVHCCSFVYPKEELKEQEIRNKVIDEFLHKLFEASYEDYDNDHLIVDYAEAIDIAEQMKGV